MDFDWTDSSSDGLSIHLTKQEEACYAAMFEDRPRLFEYRENEYSKYCADSKKIIAMYIEEFGLGKESINRIFERYFM